MEKIERKNANKARKMRALCVNGGSNFYVIGLPRYGLAKTFFPSK